MSDQAASEGSERFASEWMSWLALHHLLPASALRELLALVVERASSGAHSLGDLFEEELLPSPVWAERWTVAPREAHGEVARYLQSLVRALVWRADYRVWVDPPNLRQADWGAELDVLDTVVSFGAMDFASCEGLARHVAGYPKDRVQRSFAALVNAVDIASKAHSESAQRFWERVNEALGPVDMPLSAIAVKHLADLCADVDRWDAARDGYRHAKSLLEEWRRPEWAELTAVWKDLLVRCEASALRTTVGPKAAAEHLRAALCGVSLHGNTLFRANASHDAFVAAAESEDGLMTVRDSRVSALGPALLETGLDLAPALESWEARKYEDAHRKFWATLRRQVALGSASQSRDTKALYARSLLDEVMASAATARKPAQFQLAVRLLVEAGRVQVAERCSWNEQAIGSYVDDATVLKLISIADAHTGTHLERHVVCIELFKEWAANMPPTRRDEALLMWRQLATLAESQPAAFQTAADVGRRALEALRYLAEKRPELRREVAPAVVRAVVAKLGQNSPWFAMSTAFETAELYADALSEGDIDALTDATLDVLARIDPNRGVWPVVRPALTLLLSSAVKARAAQSGAARRILDEILRFGVEQDTEHSQLFFYLNDFDPALLRDAEIRSRLEVPLGEVRRGAKQINSTAVTGCIDALLLAPAIAGPSGMGDAMVGLANVLESVTRTQPSPGLPFAYNALLIIASRSEKLGAEFGEDTEAWDSVLKRVAVLVAEVWRAAAKEPLVLAPFAMPPLTKPDSVLVHNWAFASMRYAETTGSVKLMEEALSQAAQTPALSEAIALARATRAVGNPVAAVDLEQIAADTRDSFYAALGRRLAQLQRATGGQAPALARALVVQCLRFGPRQLDAAVLLEALRNGIRDEVRAVGLEDYSRRLEVDRDLRLLLTPIVDLFLNEVAQA